MYLGRFGVVGLSYPPLDQVQSIHRDTQDLLPRVFDRERLDLLTSHYDALQAHEAADPMVQVNHVVSRSQLSQAFQRDSSAESTSTADPSRASEDLVIGKDQEGRVGTGELETPFQRAHHHLRAGRQDSAISPQDLLQPLSLPFVVAQ